MNNMRTISQLTDQELTNIMNWRTQGLSVHQIAGVTRIDHRELTRFFKDADTESSNAA